MRIYFKGLIIILLLGISGDLLSQDFYYSQFFNTPSYYNPATVGYDRGLKTRVHYRKHWPVYDKDLEMYNFEVDFAEREVPGLGGFGFLVNSCPEGDGVIKKNSAGMMFSSRIQINRNLLTQLGFSGLYVQKTTDFSNNYVFSGQLDNKHGLKYPDFSVPGFQGVQSISYADLNLGALIAYEKDNILARGGFAVHHLLKPEESFNNNNQELPRRYVVHGDMVITPRRNPRGGITYNPGFLFENHVDINTYQIGMNASKSILYMGVWYRSRQSQVYNIQSLIALVGVVIPIDESYSRIKLHYTYDIGLGYLPGTGGSHEISLNFEFDRVRLVRRWSNYSHEMPVIREPIRF